MALLLLRLLCLAVVGLEGLPPAELRLEALGRQNLSELNDTTFAPGTTLNTPTGMPDAMKTGSPGYFINPTWLGRPGAELGDLPGWPGCRPHHPAPAAGCLPRAPALVAHWRLCHHADDNGCALFHLPRVQRAVSTSAASPTAWSSPKRTPPTQQVWVVGMRHAPSWGKEEGVGATAVATPCSPSPCRPRPAPRAWPSPDVPGCALATASPKPAAVAHLLACLRPGVCGCRDGGSGDAQTWRALDDRWTGLVPRTPRHPGDLP